MSIKYQQGDVLLVAVTKRTESDIRSECKIEKGGDKEGKVILALGEATGHHHRFELNKLDPGVTVSAFHGSGFCAGMGSKMRFGWFNYEYKYIFNNKDISSKLLLYIANN